MTYNLYILKFTVCVQNRIIEKVRIVYKQI
jgi:hypothetical protein